MLSYKIFESESISEPALWAARNNAAWCEALCKVHGALGKRTDGSWICRGEVPERYPNIVTFEAGDPASQVAHVEGLLAGPLDRPWAVKDSFCQLDLAPLGFETLIEGSWLCLETPSPQLRHRSDLHWTRIMSGPRLAEWERAVLGVGCPRLFPPALLADSRVWVLGGFGDQGLVAGAILFDSTESASTWGQGSPPVIGYSNLFLADGASEIERHAVLEALVGAIASRFPDRPIVGWEPESEVPTMERLGFEAVGRLRVWLAPSRP